LGFLLGCLFLIDLSYLDHNKTTCGFLSDELYNWDKLIYTRNLATTMPAGDKHVSRRSYLKYAGTVGIAGVAGCTGDGNGNGGNGEGNDNDTNGGGGSQTEYDWTMAVAVGEGHAFEIGAQAFKEELESQSGGRFNIEVASGGAYGSEIEQMETCGAGGVELISQSIGVGTATIVSAKAFGTIGTAWVYEDPIWEHHLNVYEELDSRIDMQSSWENEGMTILADPIYAGERHVASNEVLKEPEDTEGIAIRVPQAPGWADYFGEIGFEPVSMPITEVYQALQTGQIQASEGEVMQLVSQSTQEVQDYYNITAHFPNGFFLVANADTYTSLSSEDQELVSEAAAAARQSANEEITQVEEDLMVELENSDEIEINRDANVEAFRERVRPVTAQWLEDNDAELSLEEIDDLAP